MLAFFILGLDTYLQVCQVAKNLYFAKHFREYQPGKHIIYLPCNLL